MKKNEQPEYFSKDELLRIKAAEIVFSVQHQRLSEEIEKHYKALYQFFVGQ